MKASAVIEAVKQSQVAVEGTLKQRAKKLLQRKNMTLLALANELDCSPAKAESLIESLRLGGLNVSLKHGEALIHSLEPGGEHSISPKLYAGHEYRFGIVSDNHLCSKYSRLDVLNSLYDIFAEEGVSDVYNAGNILDGECRFNRYDLVVPSGMESQLEYAAVHYPKRKGITTHYVVGDDHEGWWAQREGIDVGAAMQRQFEAAGRTDMNYLGYIEADIKLQAPKGETWIRLMHAGGGSAYALSYAPQKIVESFQGGEKPHVLIIGHYHKMEFCAPREVFCISAGCTQDQTPFMRKQKIQAFVGGWVCRMIQAPDGHVSSMSTDWRRFYDRKFYVGEKFKRW